MLKILTNLCALGLALSASGAPEVLIVADEFPAMQVLAGKLKAEEGIASRIVAQTNMPADLSPYAAVIVYIHLKLEASAERAFIDYAEAGGKLIPLHHSISSGKRKNTWWFKFLGVTLPEGDVTQGGYKWIEPVTLDWVNLAPDHFIMTNRVSYPKRVAYAPEGATDERPRPGFTLKDSEVYINHTLTGPRTILMGFKYTDAKSGRIFMQDRAGWLKRAGKGWIIYFQAGHSAADFEEPAYGRILANAVVYQPSSDRPGAEERGRQPDPMPRAARAPSPPRSRRGPG